MPVRGSRSRIARRGSSSSSANALSSRSCISAVAVTVLEIDARKNGVSSEALVPSSKLAVP
jgi:hypothetical protein